MPIPGLVAKHAIITETCIANRGEEGAVDEALQRCRQELLNCVAGWRGTKGVKFHVAVTVERPPKEDDR